MRRRHALSIAFVALIGALAIFALPALAGAKGEDHHHGHDHMEHRHHHGDRHRHDNVGRISAFDPASGELTVARFGGGSISGLVTGATEIKCEGQDEESESMASRSRDGGGNSGRGSSGDGGRGEEEPGDDHGEGVEPGDDNGDRNAKPTCTTADLTVGALVREADREFPNGVATFDEIELGHSS